MSALNRLNLSTVTKSSGFISETQKQTQDTFSFKWAKRDTYESQEFQDNARKWLLERYCNHDVNQIASWLAGERKIILDAGCGSGFSAMALFGDYLNAHDYLGVDISDSIEVAKIRFNEKGYCGDFLKADLINLPIPDESVDIIFSEGVLHHTDNTEKAVSSLSKKLKVGGLFLFYIYAKKSIIREFTDDFIRDQLSKMTDQEAWEALKPLTQLGISLGQLNIELEISDDIPILGIKKGKIDLQRFFYWNICKAYYRSEFSLEEINHINFDWFRPLNCHRHTEEEIISFCKNSSLTILHKNIQESGITIVAKKEFD